MLWLQIIDQLNKEEIFKQKREFPYKKKLGEMSVPRQLHDQKSKLLLILRLVPCLKNLAVTSTIPSLHNHIQS